MSQPAPGEAFPSFDRDFFSSPDDFTVIGPGSVGGKARGLAFVRQILETRFEARRYPHVEVNIPRLTVLATGVFERFLQDLNVAKAVALGEPDDEIALVFQRAPLPALVAGDLRALAERVHQPLAVRSSSRLEDALNHPFAGVYETKMTPHNQPAADVRFKRLVEAVKFVWASTFRQEARTYLAAIGRAVREERMAVILQEVVGRRHGDRYYPDVSGVARSWNFYPLGHAEPADGVVSLALGLGKTIVDGGLAWSFVPAYPASLPPYGTLRELLFQTQTRYWAVSVGKQPAWDPIRETEYLVEEDLEAAERNGVLDQLVSTCDLVEDRMRPGLFGAGARVLTFAPLLADERYRLPELLRDLLAVTEQEARAPVEIEFALSLPRERDEKLRFAVLQARPMLVTKEEVQVPEEELGGPGVLVGSRSALGNGRNDGIADIVYVRPERFDAARSRAIAGEIEALNAPLVAAGRPYLLIGFGRWGSSDPWLGIPVRWAQIAGARAVVEATLPGFLPDPSQGSHFFHNITSFRVFYFSVRSDQPPPIDWAWLDACPEAAVTGHARHVRLSRPLRIRVDGRSRRGLVLRPEE